MVEVSIDKLIEGALHALPKRQSEVLEGRYGLKNGAEMTLASLGKRFGVTRERIRQIQNLALLDIKARSAETGITTFGTVVKKHLESLGGVRREETLVEDIAHLIPGPKNTKTFRFVVRFLMDAVDGVSYHLPDRNYHGFWYISDGAVKKSTEFLTQLVKVVGGQKDAILNEKGGFEVRFSTVSKACGVNEFCGANMLAISKKFSTNNYGDSGLASWPEVNPKTARDWAYLILKKEQKPLHFTAITEGINKVRVHRVSKRTNYQTVHNELIKDARFVLVGRGTYGLEDFGIMPGTAKEVMSNILRENGALKSKELIQLVLERRIFKENTLLLNLQNKKYFKRLDDGRYDVKIA